MAIRNIHLYPIEVNKASYFQLLRIPGIGPLSASRIVKARRTFKLTSLQELKNMGIVAKRAAPFLLVKGRHPDKLEKMLQLKLWSDTDDYRPQFPTAGLHQGFTAFWEAYYDTQWIEGRFNPRLARKHLPKKLWSWVKEGKKLDLD